MRFVLLLSLLAHVYGQDALSLNDGTPVRLRLTRNLSSADARVGDTVDFETLEDISAGGVIVAPRGSVALATVTEAKERGRMGKSGKLNVNIDVLKLSSGEKVPLRAVREGAGGSNVGKMTGAIVATSIVFFPAAPLFLFMKGKDIVIPKGTEITAYVASDIKLNPGQFGAKPQPAGQVSAAKKSGKAITNEDVLAMKEAGLGDDLILAKIESSDGSFSLEAEDLIKLKKAGLSEAVLKAMLGKK